MIPKECKRLAEVDFPIAVVSKHSAREKSIRHGHPSTLHLWWARRPLAACRAMLMALLLPDPCDAKCPEEFITKARELLLKMPGWNTPRMTQQLKSNEGLRKALLTFIGDFANWDNAANQNYLTVSRALVKAAHPEETPLVVDPFAGGGSIPLEALRIGCETFASDLNPVACLILKVMLEDIPRHGPELAEELRRVGKEIKEKAAKELAEFYPKDPDLPAPRRGKCFVYVLKCSDDSFYIGQSEDIPRRLKQHETGEVSWTAKHLPVEIIHWEEFNSRDAAVKREKDLKTGFGRKWLKREYKAGNLAARQAGGATPIAYLWARTVKCESPNCGAEIPLMRSFWLCKKANRKRALRYKVVRPKGDLPAEALAQAGAPRVEFEVFEPKSDKEVIGGTVTRGNAACPCCNMVLPVERVRVQLAEQRGGADVIFDKKGNRIGGARMTAVVTLHPGMQGRHYRLPTKIDYQAVWKAQNRLQQILDEWERGGRKGLCPVPDEPLPPIGTLGFRVQRYGMLQWSDLFMARQKVALLSLVSVTQTVDKTIRELCALAVGRTADQLSSLVRWLQTIEAVASTFGRQALPIVWDFCEIIPTGTESANFGAAFEWVAKVVELQSRTRMSSGQCEQADASASPMPDQAAPLFFTDPPYYDAIPYSDLADYFFVWIKRTLPGHRFLKDPFDTENPLTPKTVEAVQDETRRYNGQPKDRTFFEDAMYRAFSEGRRVLKDDGIGSVVFAHKTTEGWEALLSGMIRAGWTITASWPIVTERSVRVRAMDSAALATSVHLVCRPRPQDASVGDWADILREFPKRVGDWMERLQGEGIRGADLVFACIGPALEIFSRYRKVETADGGEVTLAKYLEKVWEVVGRLALEQVLGTAETGTDNNVVGAIEEDARLTALFLWTLQTTNGNGKGKSEATDNEGQETTSNSRPKGYSLIFDVVRRFAQPLGIDLPRWEGRIIETKKGVVRLMAVTERAKLLFGEDDAEAAIEDYLSTSSTSQLLLPGFEYMVEKQKRKRTRGQKFSFDDPSQIDATATTLDRVHAAMLLQLGGQANALRALIKTEQDRGPDFLRLANALSALYPKGSEEKRLLDAMLLAVPR